MPAEQATCVAGREHVHGLHCVCACVLVTGVSTGDFHLLCLSFAQNRRGRGGTRATCALRQCKILSAPSGEPLPANSQHEQVPGQRWAIAKMLTRNTGY